MFQALRKPDRTVQNTTQPEPLAQALYKQKLDRVTAEPPGFTTVTR